MTTKKDGYAVVGGWRKRYDAVALRDALLEHSDIASMDSEDLDEDWPKSKGSPDRPWEEMAVILATMSEDVWCASWLIGIEDDAWRVCFERGPSPDGWDDAATVRLRELFDEFGVWPHLCDDRIFFLPMRRRLAMGAR